jgi:hypothetical protein
VVACQTQKNSNCFLNLHFRLQRIKTVLCVCVHVFAHV